MKPEMMKLPVFLCIIVLTSATVPVYALSQEDAERVDFLCQKGVRLAERDSLAAAVAQFQAALEINRKHAPSYVGLGNVYLKMDKLGPAEKEFRRALRWRKNYAPTLNGLGNVFLRTKNELQWAVKYFQYACQADITYTDAYYNLAIAYRMIGDTRELNAYERLVKTNPTHDDGWFQIGRIFHNGESGQYINYYRAERAYRKQIEANPDHFQAYVHLGKVLKELNRTEEAVRILRPLIEDSSQPYQYEALEVLAEVHQKRREYERSEALFEAYIAALEPDRQAVFYDLSLVAEGAELDRFREATKAQWKSLSEAFWAGRDPAPVTLANERMIEHYRRVAFSLEHYGRNEFPWDARGEVYVRYGRPDHISQSENIRFETVPKVIAVKERLINQAGRGIAGLIMSRDVKLDDYDVDISSLSTSEGSAAPLGPVSSMLRELSETGKHRTTDFGVEGMRKGAMGAGASFSSDTMMMLSGILGWPVYPVYGKVWEYWIYTDVGPGIEITFTQPFNPGPFDYADMPMGIGGDSQVERVWQQMNPRIVIDWTAAATPSVYEPDFATTPLEFFFNSAQFKGLDDVPYLEVYYGVPVGEMTFVKGEDGRPTAYLKRGVALLDENNRPVFQSSKDMIYYSQGVLDTTETAFVPELDRISASPGTYLMSVQVLDQSSYKSQVYRQQVTLFSYGGKDLQLSDIEMASSIRTGIGGKFSKRDIEVVPNPSLGYLPGKPVFIYYEIYNLTKDEFGATKFRVQYEVESTEEKNVAARILSAMGHLVGIREQRNSVTIEYSHVGNEEDDFVYLEFDMSETDPGRHTVKVRVIDENTHRIARSVETFEIR